MHILKSTHLHCKTASYEKVAETCHSHCKSMRKVVTVTLYVNDSVTEVNEMKEQFTKKIRSFLTIHHYLQRIRRRLLRTTRAACLGATCDSNCLIKTQNKTVKRG